MKKRIMLLLVLLLAALVFAAQAEGGTCEDGLTWVLEDGTLTISGSGAMKDYYIDITQEEPEDYDLPPWYYTDATFTKLVIEPGVTSIGDFAFVANEVLESVTLPNGVTSIGDCAFIGCTVLPSIALPDSVTSIGEMAFVACEALASAELGTGLKTIGSGAFVACEGLAIITLPAGVTSIGEAAFAECYALEEVLYGGTLGLKERIGIGPDNECLLDAVWTYLIDPVLSLPDGLKVLDAEALSGIKAERIDIPASVETIGSDAFSNCADLEELVFEGDPESIADDAAGSITGITVFVRSSGTAEAWADRHGYDVVYMG